MAAISLTMIRVGSEQLTAADETVLSFAVNDTRTIFGSVGMTINRVEDYFISGADAGGSAVIDQTSEADFLTSQRTVPITGIDAFVVTMYVGGIAGLSPVNGPCNMSTRCSVEG